MGKLHLLIEAHGVEGARAMAETQSDRLAVKVAAAVMADEEARLGITHAGFAMTSLPHKRVETTVWERDAGAVKLLVESGLEQDLQPVGIPYGSIARMILLYLQTQAVKTKSREVELGTSMNAWLGAMGIPVGGKTYQIVREQSRRISACRLTFLRQTPSAKMRTNGAFVREAIMSPNPGSDQLLLWQDRVELDAGFYQSLIDHPLPLREAAIREISSRSMAIDLYIWLAYRLHALNKPTPVSWISVYGQFGSGYDRLRNLKPRFLEALKIALAVYPEAQVEMNEEAGLLLIPSPPPVVERHRRLGHN
jgi:Plasmid encoded RepA protein